MLSLEVANARARLRGAGAGVPESPLPNSPRSLNRQAKLQRMLKELHSSVAENGSGAEDEVPVPKPASGGKRPAGSMPPPPPPPGGGKKRKREEGAPSGAAGSSSNDDSSRKNGKKPLKVDVAAAEQGRGSSLNGTAGGKKKAGGGGGGGGGASSSSAAAPSPAPASAGGKKKAAGGGASSSEAGGGGASSSSGPPSQPQPNFKKKKLPQRPTEAPEGSNIPKAKGEGPELTAPKSIFKNNSFTTDPPPEANRYDFGAVPGCKGDLDGSVLMRPASRRQWFACIQELESLAQESLDRRAARLGMNTPSGLPLVYIADRMDIDDPLWGYQLRVEETGWLQGFITCTVFTTWTHFFEWNSMQSASGIPAARVANSFVGKEDAAMIGSDGGETVGQVAARAGIRPSDLVKWNASRFPSISANSRVQNGTYFFVVDPSSVDTVSVEKPKGETPKALAAKVGVPVKDLIELNAASHPELTATTKLPQGTELLYRDRQAEPDVFLPTRKQERALDDDGKIASQLQAQKRFGDPTTTGVVWPKVAEIGLVAGLGAGKVLVRLALEELRASGEYDFVVLQATMASVSFYEELGFVRVGAIAKYFPEGTSLEANPVQGYRHWACADESQPEQFGDTSYMMAQRCSEIKPDKSIEKLLKSKLVRDWPAVQHSGPKKSPGGSKGKGKSPAAGGSARGHNQAGILKPKGSELQVGDMSLNVDEGDDARLQLRYEVERIVGVKGDRYLVKWKHLSVEEATWEKVGSELLSTANAKAAIQRFKKSESKKGHGDRSGGGGGAGAAGSSAEHAKRKPDGPVRWHHRIVRPLPQHEPLGSAAGAAAAFPIGQAFNGGLGEPPRLNVAPPAEVIAPGGLEREHRYWLVVKYVSLSNKCTLVPLMASGRFGGCGRRAGRIRWKAAPLKQGYERDAQASVLEVVGAEAVQGAREAEGEVWCVDDMDVEQAAREQAAAARNRRRAMLDEPLDEATLAQLGELGGLTRAASSSLGLRGELGLYGAPARPRVPASTATGKRKGASTSGGGSGGSGGAKAGGPARKKKRLAPASNTCLACTKGKHCAHTCGVRGKMAEALLREKLEQGPDA